MEDRILQILYPKLIITGERKFIERYGLFLASQEQYFPGVTALSAPSLKPAKSKSGLFRQLSGGYPVISYLLSDKKFDPHRSIWAFRYKSRYFKRILSKSPPDVILQLFGMFNSAPGNVNCPLLLSLDYTMALAEKNYPLWAEFPTQRQRNKWMELERRTYESASFLFPWSELAARSLQEDYGIASGKIVVTGSGGNFNYRVNEVKKFGSGILLMNGSDFYRKGGDIALEAFKIIQQSSPGMQLIITGSEEQAGLKNVRYTGMIKNESQMRKLFTEADLVLGPARCDPFPGFLIEAMQCGTPCVVSGADAMPEIVDHGINGVVLEELSPENLATAVLALSRDPKRLQQFSLSAKNKVARKLNWNHVSQTIYGTLRENAVI